MKMPLDDIIAKVPPTYQLNYLVTDNGTKLRPTHPIQMIPIGTRKEVLFKYWGMNTYDVHDAFSIPGHRVLPCVVGINYCILVIGENEHSVRADYQHPFKHTVHLGTQGIHSHHNLFTLYRALEHLPVLPKDWQYIQFIA